MGLLTKTYIKDWTDDSIWIINTPSESSKLFLLYVQEIGLFKALPNYYTEHKDIASYLVMLTLSGKGEYFYEGKKYELTKNTLVFANCMEHHTHNTAKSTNETWELIWVQFNGISAQGYYNQFKSKQSPVITIKENSSIFNIMHKLLKINETKSMGTELLSSQLLVELLTKILFAAGAVTSPKINMPDYIQSSLRDIDAHFSDNLSLDYFSKKLAVSKFHFAKEFKKYTGFSPNEYIVNARINHAKRMLQHSSAPVYEIAQEVGFNNVSHFINTFRKKELLTPRQFRKRYQYNSNQENKY